MGTTYEGNVSDLWKAWHEEGVDVIKKCGEHWKKWRATCNTSEVNHYNRLSFIIDHIVEEVGGNTDLLTATLIQMDGEKSGVKLSTVYTRIKKIIKLESPMKY
jgi:hypothetical protein